MLDRALYELYGDIKNNETLEKDILLLSDEQFLAHCINDVNKKINKTNNEAVTRSKELLVKLQNRELFTNLCAYSFDDIRDDLRNTRTRILNTYAEGDNCRKNKIAALRLIESDFKLPYGSLAMYCPSAKMNAKIPKVKIAVDGNIESFDIFEENHSDLLSGGHLQAQLTRFKRLWKVQFFIDRSLKKVLEKSKDCEAFISILRDAVQILILNHVFNEENPIQASFRLVKELTCLDILSWKYEKMKSKEDLNSVLSGKGNTNNNTYPFGAPSLRSFLIDSSAKSVGKNTRKISSSTETVGKIASYNHRDTESLRRKKKHLDTGEKDFLPQRSQRTQRRPRNKQE